MIHHLIALIFLLGLLQYMLIFTGYDQMLLDIAHLGRSSNLEFSQQGPIVNIC